MLSGGARRRRRAVAVQARRVRPLRATRTATRWRRASRSWRTARPPRRWRRRWRTSAQRAARRGRRRRPLRRGPTPRAVRPRAITKSDFVLPSGRRTRALPCPLTPTCAPFTCRPDRGSPGCAICLHSAHAKSRCVHGESQWIGTASIALSKRACGAALTQPPPHMQRGACGGATSSATRPRWTTPTSSASPRA